MNSTRHFSFALGSAALLGITLGACFTGTQAEGLPCTANSHCGPKLECIDGYCGGVVVCGDGSTVEATLACDGTPDCEDGSDEDPAACGTDMFFCADDSTIPLEQACDGTEQCPDGEDEAHALCDLYDQCSGPDEPFEFEIGPNGPGVSNPIGLIAGQFVGDDRDDLVIAQNDGSFVRIYDVIPGQPPEPYDLAGDSAESPFFTTGVQEVAVYDFEQDTDTDIVVLTEDARLFGYFSAPDSGPPALAMGAPFTIPGQPEIVDLAMGKINDDAWVDMVAVTAQGFVVTATGDAAAGLAGEVPFSIDLSLIPIEGSSWNVVELHDIDDDGVDELLISGFDGGPRLWILNRKDNGMLQDFWEAGETMQIPIVPSEFALGDLDGMPGSDIALLERMGGKLVVLRQMSPGTFMPSGPTLELGVDINGLALVDFDCAGADDLVFNVESPASVRVQFTAEMGALEADYALEIASAGRPQGSIALLKFDPDDSWDVFHAVEQGSDVDADEFRGFLTMVPDGMP